MIIPLDKLLTYSDNRYVLTKAAMNAVDKIPNMTNYPEENHSWKVVPYILDMVLEGKLQYERSEEIPEEDE